MAKLRRVSHVIDEGAVAVCARRAAGSATAPAIATQNGQPHNGWNIELEAHTCRLESKACKCPDSSASRHLAPPNTAAPLHFEGSHLRCGRRDRIPDGGDVFRAR